MNRNLIFYILTIAIFGSLVWLVFDQGTKLETEQSARTQQEAPAEEIKHLKRWLRRVP